MKIEWVPFGDVMHLERRPVHVDLNCTYQEIGVRSFGRGLFIKSPVTGVEIGKKRVFEIQPGDLVVSNVFAWEGAVGVADDRHEGKIGSHRFMTWTSRSGANVDYLRHFFGSARGLNALGAASPGSAGRNRTLAVKRLEEIKVPMPDMDSQSRVADHLSRLALLGGGRTSVESLNPLVQRAEQLSAAILPAARNEIFNSMR